MALSPVSFPDRALASSRGNQQKTPRVLWLELKQSRKQESKLLVVCRWPHHDRNGKPIVRVGTLIRHHMVVRFLGLYCFMVCIRSAFWPPFSTTPPLSVGTMPHLLVTWGIRT